MELNEAQKILQDNGFIIEGWKDEMSTWDKVHDKKYNGEHYRKNKNGTLFCSIFLLR